ncbi:MAG: glycosyltransferase family 4 protein [Candidatus Moraniibacteriota bacterium]|nr:MAG: glycosyltransferase family 4 protein [Candidatus Moranbacteria bacterium]
MRIALLAPLWKRVPPEKYGGSELIVANLAKGLTHLGHDVTTFACGGSHVRGKLVSVIPKSMYELIGGFDWNGIKQYEFLSFFEIAKRIGDFDVIHNHMGFHPLSFAPFLSLPMVTTLHSSLPPDFPCLAEAFKAYPFVSISNAQRKLSPDLHYVATVYHGIDVKTFHPNFEKIKNDTFLFLGTLSERKGIDIAVRAAHQLKKQLIIAGEIREEDIPFLKKEVFPYIDGKNITFIGEIGHKEKSFLLAHASALLFPSRWNEAFGLVMIEALACGTPVVALNNGAIKEVLKNGKTGFVVENEILFQEALQKVGELSRETCRIDAEENFDISVMAKNYENVYKKLKE